MGIINEKELIHNPRERDREIHAHIHNHMKEYAIEKEWQTFGKQRIPITLKRR